MLLTYYMFGFRDRWRTAEDAVCASVLTNCARRLTGVWRSVPFPWPKVAEARQPFVGSSPTGASTVGPTVNFC